MNDAFKQGDIIWLDCSPQSGHEQSGRRPAIVISNYDFNCVRHFAVVCPITNTDRKDPLHVRLDNRTSTTGTILADQLRSLDVRSRNPKYIEQVPADILEHVLRIIAAITEVL